MSHVLAYFTSIFFGLTVSVFDSLVTPRNKRKDISGVSSLWRYGEIALPLYFQILEYQSVGSTSLMFAFITISWALHIYMMHKMF